MKAAEIRELTNEELMDKLEQFKSELFVLRFQNETGQLKINLLKKDIARVKTVLRERAANANG